MEGNNNFTFPARTKTITFVLMGIGIIALIWGFFFSGGGHVEGHSDNTRIWSNILISGFFFTAVGLGALFFYALQYAAEVGWSAQVKRIFEGMFAFLPIGLGVLVVVLLAGQFHVHHIWHWMDADVYNPESPAYDEIIAGKGGYFAPTFFWVRTIAYIATFIVFARLFRKWSLLEDQVSWASRMVMLKCAEMRKSFG